MKLNQYAVYRVDQTSPGKMLWHKSYSEVQQEKLSIQFEYYGQQRIEKVLPKDTAMTIWNKRKDSFEVSDVLVLNKEGELTAYYISEEEIEELCASSISFANLVRQLMEYQFYFKEEEDMNARELRVRERFFSLLAEIPDILYRVPLKHINHYLGADVTSLGYLAGSSK